MKFLKKAVSALLASVMCIPSGILSFAAASEENTVTTVTLAETENGFMQFSEDSMKSSTADQDGYHMVQVGEDGELEQVENDGSMWAYSYGDFVEVELVPDEGYNVKSFTIKDSESGDIMASKATMDNIFSFTMPARSVTVEAVFSDSETIEIVPDDEQKDKDDDGAGEGDGDKLDIQSSYHDITATDELSQKEVEETIFDLATESYIKANVDPKLLELDGTNLPVDVLLVKQTLYDGRYVNKDETIDDVMGMIEDGDEAESLEGFEKFIGMIESAVYVYDYSKSSDYYVAYANTMHKDANSRVQDWAFAYNNLNGMSVDGCIYDDQTGLLYIPKQAYTDMNKIFAEEENDFIIQNMQVQFMQVFDADELDSTPSDSVDVDSQINTVDLNDDETALDVSTQAMDILSGEITAFVDAGMDESKLEVSVNGILVDPEFYAYSADTGELVIAQSSAGVVSVEAREKDEAEIKDKLIETISEKAKADVYDQMKNYCSPLKIKPSDMPKSTNKNLFRSFQVSGKCTNLGKGNTKRISFGQNGYLYYGNGNAFSEKAAAIIADYARGSSDTKPKTPYELDKDFPLNHKTELGNAAYLSGLKNETLLRMLRKFGTKYTPCSHIDRDSKVKNPQGNVGSGSRFWARVVKINDPKQVVKKSEENGKQITTTTWEGGYVVFAVASTQVCTQTSTMLFKVPFYYEKTDSEPIVNDPLYLGLYKDANRLAVKSDGTELDNTKLGGAIFACDFYEDQNYSDAKDIVTQKEAGKISPTAQWKFKTFETATRGSDWYQQTMDKLEDSELYTNVHNLAGIDFGPKQGMYTKDHKFIPRSEWVNKFILSDGLKSWQKKFGKKGSYHIYEIKPPNGFRLAGYAFDANNSTGNKTEGLLESDSMVVYMDNDVDNKEGKKTNTFINGQKSNNKLVGLDQGAVIYVRDKIDDVKIRSEANPHEADADSGELTISDSLLLYPLMTRLHVDYDVTVTLLDITADKYVDVKWDTSTGGVASEEVEDSGDTFFSPSSITYTVKAEDIDWTGIDFDSDKESDKKTHPIEVSGTIDTTGLAGHTLVFMVSVDGYDRDAVDEDDASKGSISYTSEKTETSEQIYFPDEVTHGFDTSMASNDLGRKAGTGEVLAAAGKSQSFTDTITYAGLKNGKKYTVKSWLVDAATGQKAKDKAGKAIEYSGTQTADVKKKEWDIKFTFDTTGMEGKRLVAYTEIYEEGASTPVYSSKDSSGWQQDLHETIMIPSVSTELTDRNTTGHSSTSGNSKFVDTINYTNLIPGANYRILTTIVNCKTGATVASKTSYDVAKGQDGAFDVQISVTIPAGGEDEYVAYEELQIEKGKQGSGNWVTVAEHKDPNDDNQKIFKSGLKTYAFDQKTNYNLSYAEKYVNLFDVVHYDNLEPNEEYLIVSKLVDKATGQVVTDDNGEEMTMEMKFTTQENFELGQYIDNKPYDGDFYSSLKGDLSGVVKPDGTFSGNFKGNVTYTKKGRAYGDLIPNNHENGGIGFTLNAESFAGRTLVFYEELYKMENGGKKLIASETNRSDANQTIRFPKITTNAVDVATNAHVSLGGDGTTIIKDTVTYSNLIPGQTYRLKGRVVDKRKSEAAGKEVIAAGTDGKEARSTTDFTPSSSSGTETLTFDIDTSKYTADDLKNYKGAIFVVYEELYVIQKYDGDDDESIVATHTDLNDENQTVYIPCITTTLKDTKTGLHIMYAESNAALTDTISYHSFKPGQAYYVSGRLVDMKTGKTLKDSSGREAKIDYQRVAAEDSGDGTWELTYNLDASALAGTTVVAYATVYVQGGTGEGGYTPVAVHEDFFDSNERVYIPHIDTTLLDQKTDSHYALAEKDVVLYDTVHYTDIHPGDYEYKFESELRDQAIGEVVVDDAGRKLSLTTIFHADFDMRDDQYATYGDVIPQNYEGSGITFELDGEYFHDRTLVCYERMYVMGADGSWKIVADHQELLDSDQTVHIGKGWTEAVDGTTRTQTGQISKNATIVDTFYYRNLNPEYTYELKGKVVDKTATIANGTEAVVAEHTASNLRPEASSGTWKNSFTFDATKFNTEEYYGATLVVYEELYQIKRYGGADDRLLIASECDVNSASQTVWYPHIETELLETTNGTHVMAAGTDRELTDTVSYHNMQPGTSYALKGWLVDMETGQVLTDSAGKRMEKTVDVMSTDNGDGEWKISYAADASALAGKLVVAYAEVYVRNGSDQSVYSRVAEHTDFWDADERVYVPVISTVATDQKTNSHIAYAEDNMWITDRVYYSYLQENTDYRLISTLVDKETGEVVTDDKGILQRIETDFNTTPNTSQEKYVQTIANPFTDSSDTGNGYAYGYVIPGDGTVLPDGEKPDGIVFSFDGGTFEGRTLVIYEELQQYNADGEWKTVATHMDLNDENQTIHIPKIRTNAVDSETMTHVSKKDGMVTIIDTVTYENLLPGMTYVIDGYLMDQSRDDEKASMPIKDADGNLITGTVTFTPDRPSGTQKVVFQGSVSDFHTDEGEFSSETLVVFEDLYLLNSKDASDDKLKIAQHRDLADENQTIYFPRVKTKAVAYGLDGNPKQGDANHVNGYAVYRCSYCKKHFLTEEEAKNHINGTVLCKNKGAAAEAVTEYTLYDTLYYENLIPGRTYQVVGTIIDTATGKAVLKGHTAVQSDTKYFTPGSRSGEVDVVFHMDGPELAGGRYVVYEEIFLNGASVAAHMDINDKDQMFNIIGMKTSAKDQETGTNISAGNTVSTIIDTVEMGPLVENEKYYLKSALMDVSKDAAGTKSDNYGSYYRDASGNAVQGMAWRVKGTSVWHGMDEPVVGPAYDRTGGMLSVEVEFKVDTITEHGGKNFQGETYVLFEELRLAGGEVVAQHKDLADAQQTIQVGGMYTVAYDKDTGTNIMAATEGKTLYDTVYYSNLKPSTTYKVTTRIYVKEDSNMEAGEYVEVTPLNATNLVAAAHVTSRSGTGFWTISASMPDLSKYAGKTLVVYEDIVDLDGVQVAVENNLYNESQSIHLPVASTLEADQENGLHFTRAESKWFCDNDACVTYACDGCGGQFHSEDEVKKHIPDCWNRNSNTYTCINGVFKTKAEAEKHTAAVYECDNCGVQFADKEDAEAHANGACRNATVLRATQLVRDADGNIVNELWYACSGCGAQFKTNQDCLNHINGSDTCYTYTDVNADHASFHNADAVITDKVAYANLVPGRQYRINGRVYNAETGEAALDADGNEIISSVSFVPMASRGSADLEFSFNADGMEGYRYAVYAEVCYAASKEAAPVVVARHNADLASADEAFYIPAVETTAFDSYTQTNVTLADTVTTVTDHVTFSGLKANEKYVIQGTIMDKDTMEPVVLPGSASKVTASRQFTAKATSGSDLRVEVADGIASGSADIEFTFSTEGLEGMTLVVFEELYLVQPKENVIIGQHTEVFDEKQTTHIPMMRTYAYDATTGEQTAGADDLVQIEDKVVLTNLVKGKRYRLDAVMIDPVTGKTMKDADGAIPSAPLSTQLKWDR